jgi:hypothetical protein
MPALAPPDIPFELPLVPDCDEEVPLMPGIPVVCAREPGIDVELPPGADTAVLCNKDEILEVGFEVNITVVKPLTEIVYGTPPTVSVLIPFPMAGILATAG